MPALRSTYHKESPNARAVARDVIATTLRGDKVIKGQIIKRHGYSDSVSRRPPKVTNTRAYQLEIAKTVEALEREREAQIQALPLKRDSAQYHQLITGIDVLTKNIQLLSGKSTENKAIHIEISETIALKNGIPTTQRDS